MDDSVRVESPRQSPDVPREVGRVPTPPLQQIFGGGPGQEFHHEAMPAYVDVVEDGDAHPERARLGNEAGLRSNPHLAELVVQLLLAVLLWQPHFLDGRPPLPL